MIQMRQIGCLFDSFKNFSDFVVNTSSQTEKPGHENVLIANKYGREAFVINDNFINVVIPFNEEVMKNHGTINKELTANESMVVSILLTNPTSTTNSLSETTKLSKRTIARTLLSLQEKGIIERVGSNKIGSWKILK